MALKWSHQYLIEVQNQLEHCDVAGNVSLTFFYLIVAWKIRSAFMDNHYL